MQTRKLVLTVMIGSLLAMSVILYSSWRRGFVVAKSGNISVRKVPLSVGYGIAIPSVSSYTYVIEVGRYPFVTSFRVGWASYEAKSIRVI